MSDNTVHRGEIAAEDRESAFQALKAKGIKPGKLDEAPGLFNKLFGKGKRWIAIAVLVLVAIGLAWVLKDTVGRVQKIEETIEASARRQVWGDAAVIEKGVRTGWADVFPEEGERFLASFAIPGVKAGVRNANVEEVEKALGRKLKVEKSDGVESRQIKLMVEGMKSEARRFIAAGGSLQRYGERLVERQESEIAIYNKAKAELEALAASGVNGPELEALWEERNEDLRIMGIRLVSMPDEP